MLEKLNNRTIGIVKNIKIDIKSVKPKRTWRELIFYEGFWGKSFAWLTVTISALVIIISALIKAGHIESKNHLLIVALNINFILLVLSFSGSILSEAIKVFKFDPLVNRLEWLHKEMKAVQANLMSNSHETLLKAKEKIDFIIQYEKQRITYMLGFALMVVPFSVYRVFFTDFADAISLLSQLNWPTIIIMSFAAGILGGGLLVQSQILVWTRYSYFIKNILEYKNNNE